MRCENLDTESVLEDPTSDIGYPLSISLPSVSPSQSLSSETTFTSHRAPLFQLSQSAFQNPGKISSEELHTEMVEKQEYNIPTAVTISPALEEQKSPDVDGISLQSLSKSILLPRPTRENVLRRLSLALMRKSLTMIDLSQRGLEPSDGRLVGLALLQNSSLSILKLGYNNLGDEGLIALASGIAVHGTLSSLDLGFNNIGDSGCFALASAISSTRGTLRTLYLSGNSITDSGTRALADIVRSSRGLRQLHLTGNCIGPEGCCVIINSIIEDELIRKQTASLEIQNHVLVNNAVDVSRSVSNSPESFMEELFLGGTVLCHEGCSAVASLLRQSTSLRILSLGNCHINDEQIATLVKGIAENREHLPLSTLQFSFNAIGPAGLEVLLNALWGSRFLRVLKLDNNVIGDEGASLMAHYLISTSITHLDIGFNSITANGMRPFMKTIAENRNIQSLSLSGNNIDSACAKAVAYALAYNNTLRSLFLDQCNISSEGRRHITAGIVSNSRTSLQIFKGFPLGERAFSLGLPNALEQWTNEKVLHFILLMWERMRQEQEQSSYEKSLDPLHLLTNGDTNPVNLISGPLDPATVIAVAQRAFETLSETDEKLLSRLPIPPKEPSFESPVLEDAIILESSVQAIENFSSYDTASNDFTLSFLADQPKSTQPQAVDSSCMVYANITPNQVLLSAADRKKLISQWLTQHMYHMNELSHLPFNSSELWRLHQYFFVPTFSDNYTGCLPNPDSSDMNSSSCSFSATKRNSILSEPYETTQYLESSDNVLVRTSAPSMNAANSSLPLLKRKVSYRYLHESYSNPDCNSSPYPQIADESIAKIIEDMNVQFMQPKSKRAREHRPKVYFVPRIKAKLESYLVSCHQKALILLRQLFFVEKCLLSGQIYPIESQSITHLSGALAEDAELVLIDFM